MTGNVIVNTGDYMFYVVNGAGTNGEGGIRAMMDIPALQCGTTILLLLLQPKVRSTLHL